MLPAMSTTDELSHTSDADSTHTWLDDPPPLPSTPTPPQVHLSNHRTNYPHHSTKFHLNLSDCWGDELDDTPGFRLLYQNINCIKSANDWQHWTEISSNLFSHNFQCFGFAETNIPWSPDHVSKLQSKLRRPTPINRQQALLSTASSNEISLSPTYQPGGTATGLLGPWSGRAIQQISDPAGLGRWSGFSLVSSNNRQLHIITAYRPCQHSISNAGDETAYAQQFRILRTASHSSPEPRQQFLTDLGQQLQQWSSSSHDIILMMDGNESISNQGPLHRFVTQHNLIDAIASKHGPHAPTTYSRGRQCIDYLFITPRLAPTIHKCGILPFAGPITISDHSGLWITFDSTTPGQTPSSTERRRIEDST